MFLGPSETVDGSSLDAVLERGLAVLATTGSSAPFIGLFGTVIGIIGDRINFIFNQAEIPLAWQKSPARRQLDIIKKNDRREGAAGWFKTPERETFAKFSRAIYQDRETNIFGFHALGIAKVLAAVVKAESPDLVVTGLMSDDGNFSAVPPMLAELCDMPSATSVLKVDGANG